MRSGFDYSRVVHVPGKHVVSTQVQSTEDGLTYIIRSACRVRLPNLCEENIMVLFPRSSRRRTNRSDGAATSVLVRNA